MTERLFIMAEWFPEVTKATKGQKIENLTALLCKGEPEGVVLNLKSSNLIGGFHFVSEWEFKYSWNFFLYWSPTGI